MLSFLFPPICPLCAKELLDKGEHICKICSKKQIFIKEPTCYSCGKSMKNQEKEYCSDCRQHPKNFERGMGLCIYQKPVTDSLAAIKYKNERKFAQYYLEENRKRKYRELLRLKADAVIPVPIHKKKRRKRGFNQAEIFAKGIAEMIAKAIDGKAVAGNASSGSAPAPAKPSKPASAAGEIAELQAECNRQVFSA